MTEAVDVEFSTVTFFLITVGIIIIIDYLLFMNIK